jgi:hypothetical protein
MPRAAAVPALRPPAIALVSTLGVLAVARLVLAFVPRMDLWGLNLHRFLPAPVAWLPWLAGVVAIMLAIARRPMPWVDRLGDATVTGRSGAIAWMVVAGTLVLLLPDQTHMTGDFILRRRAIEEGTLSVALSPQVMGLDVWLHYSLPRVLFERFQIPADTTARLWGAVDSALLALSGVVFARALRLRGAAAFAATGVIVCSGALALFTGYGKGLADEVVTVAAVSALGTLAIGRGSGYVGLGVVTTLAVALHRIGLFLVTAAQLAFGLAMRRHGRSEWGIGSFIIATIAGALAVPRVFSVFHQVDVPVHLAHGGGWLRALDVVNALLLCAPLALLVPVALAAFGRGLPRRAEILPAALLALELCVLSFVIAPQQGMLRDWDDFAPAAMALSVLAAWLAAEVVGGADALAGAPARAARAGGTAGSLALAIVLAAAVPSVQWLVHLHDVPHGMQRVRAAIHEWPLRSELERARLWDFIGVRSAWLDDWSTAADAFAQSAALLPTPRVLDQWARAEIRRDDWPRARDVCRLWTTGAPDDVTAWRVTAAVVTHQRDRVASREAAEQILRLAPGDADATDILNYLNRTEERAPR